MNALHDRGNIAIEAWFSDFREPDRDWRVDPDEWRFSARMLPCGTRRVVRTIELLRTERPDVFVTLFGDAAFATTVLAAKCLGTPVVIHAMRTFASWRKRSFAREAAKHALFRLVDGVQVTGPSSRAYAQRYGAKQSSVFAIREEVDIPFWGRAAADRESRAALRASHNLSGCVFLYVGRLWWGKGIDVLLDAFAAVRASSADCSLVVVGCGEEEERLRSRAGSGVVFAGHHEGDVLRAWYAAADALVFPTLGDPYGQVTQEAMAAGLPVISTTAAGDIEDRVIPGQTGYLVPPGDVNALAVRMRQVAAEPDLRARLGARGRERVQDWSTERWAQRFEEMILAVLGSKSGRCGS